MTHARGSWFVGVLALVAAACGDGAIGTGTGGGASGGTGGTAGSGGTGGAGGISGGNGAPVILSFSASPASLAAAGQATLSWQVTGATSLSIDHGVGDVTGASTAVSVTATTIYTLTATNAMGSGHATTAVVVGQNPARRTPGRSCRWSSPPAASRSSRPQRCACSRLRATIPTSTPTSPRRAMATTPPRCSSSSTTRWCWRSTAPAPSTRCSRGTPTTSPPGSTACGRAPSTSARPTCSTACRR